MQKVKAVVLYMMLFFLLTSVVPKTEHVKWIAISEAEANFQKEKRPVLIDLYTDWCGWCKVMDKKTYSNPKVADYLKDKFYAVRVNAETREKITWNEKTYNYNAAYRANEFAVYITKGRLEFPTTIIIPADGSEPQAIAGYLETKDFELILKYFGDGSYHKISFDEYQKNFKPSWYTYSKTSPQTIA
jgi:thioredoxin-related protein